MKLARLEREIAQAFEIHRMPAEFRHVLRRDIVQNKRAIARAGVQAE